MSKVKLMLSLQRINSNSDFNQILNKISNTKWADASEITSSDYSESSLKNFISIPQNILLIAFCDDKIAGMSSAMVLTRPDGSVWLYVDEVDVALDFQRQGVGRSMMEYFLDEASALGCEELWLGTELDNIPANGLYKSLKPTSIEKFIGYNYEIKSRK